MSTTSFQPRRSSRIAAKAASRVTPVKAVAPMTYVTPVAPVIPADPFAHLTGEDRVRAERIHKKALEREDLRWRYEGSMTDAVNVVRNKLNLLFEPGSKGWWIAFDAHPTVQEWQGAFFELVNASSGY